MQSTVVPIPKPLRDDVECIRVTTHDSDEPLSLTVCLNGLPGIVFEHRDGYSPLENITTRHGNVDCIPTLYVYGQMTEPGVMHYKRGAFTTLQVVLKPHALQTLLGLNATVMTHSLVELSEFSTGSLNMQLLEAGDEQERVTLITDYLLAKLQQARSRDGLVEESLRLIHRASGAIRMKYLLERLSISERQFEKRFSQAVGLSPHFYSRVKRFNRALMLMKSSQFNTLTAVAHALNFHDQSHFIRDFKAFSGITPKGLAPRLDDFDYDQSVFAYF